MRPEPERYSIPDLARKWDTDTGAIELYGLEGLTIRELVIEEDRYSVRYVDRTEVARFEAERFDSQEVPRAELRADAERNWQVFTGALLAQGFGSEAGTLTAAQVLEWCRPPQLAIHLEGLVSDSWIEKKLRAIRERMVSGGCTQFVERPAVTETPARTAG